MSIRCLSVTAALLALAGAAVAAPLTPGNFVVVRVGDGSAALSNAATATFLLEYAADGTLVQTILMPTAVDGANRRLTNSGTATSEAHLTRSTNGQFFVLGGYDAAPGTTGVVATTSAATNRVIARISTAGVVDTTTALTDAYNSNNIRSVATDDGTRFWTAGNASGTAGGVRFVASLGATTSTQLATTPTNIRTVNVFGGQLYTSSATGTFQGVSTVGTGLPTTAGQSLTALAGFPTATGPSPYDFHVADANTIYVADDRAAPNGGLQKWTNTGGTWSLAYTLNTFQSGTASGIRSFDAVAVCTGPSPTSPTFVATTADGRIVRITDAGATTPIVNLVAPTTNAAFRGIRSVVCPPCTAASITGQPASVTVTAPAPASFTVTAAGSGLTYAWSFNGSPIANGGAYAGATTATLSIDPTSAAVAGTYAVTVSASCGTPVTSENVTLTVNTPSTGCNLADVVAIGGNPPADGLLTGDDFNAFIAAFAASDLLADVVAIGGTPPGDGLITGDDFNAFIAAFAAGCP